MPYKASHRNRTPEQKRACNAAVYRWRKKHPSANKLSSAKWRALHPDAEKARRRPSALKSKYGLTIEGYTELWEAQNGCCAICGDMELMDPLHVDHDHTTKKVRGLLCKTCNLGIGYLRERKDLFEAAAAYIAKHSAPLT